MDHMGKFLYWKTKKVAKSLIHKHCMLQTLYRNKAGVSDCMRMKEMQGMPLLSNRFNLVINFKISTPGTFSGTTWLKNQFN